MGDRACVKLVFEPEKDKNNEKTPEQSIYFYTHWSGSELPTTIASGLLKGKSRWDDPTYLARILFCTMVGNDWDSTTGFGIQPFESTDVAYPTIVVHLHSQKITDRDGAVWSYEGYLKEFELL